MDTSMRFIRNLPRLLAFCLLGALLAVVAVGSVQAEGSASAESSVVGPGESIQKAINAADPGDTIVVRGVHREDVVIRKDGIKLLGLDAVIKAPTRARADSPCSRFFGPEGICVLGDVNFKHYIETNEVNKRVRLMFKESALGYGHDLSDYQPNGRCSEQKVATRTFSSRRIAMPKV